jgi:hypothetical protein
MHVINTSKSETVTYLTVVADFHTAVPDEQCAPLC